MLDITTPSVRYPTLTAIAVLLVFVWGIWYYNTMSRREDPSITILGAQISTIWPGALPEDIEQYVTDPIEEACEQIPEVKEVTSWTRNSISLLWVELDSETPKSEIPHIWTQLRARLARLRPTLPQGCGDPDVDDEIFDTCSHVFCITGQGLTQRELSAVAQRVKERLSALPAAGRVNIDGNLEERIYLEFDPARLTQFRLSPDSVLDMVRAQNALLPGGSLEAGGDTFALRASGEFKGLDDLRNMSIYSSAAGSNLRLGDLGTATYGYEDPPSLLCRVNGREAVAVSLIMREGKNVTVLGRQVEAELARIRADLPAGVDLVCVQDQPRQVAARIEIFTGCLRDGIILVTLLVFALMGWRAAVPVAAAIPVTLVGTFAVISLLGTDLHQLSIAALIISVGLIVDDAIVVSDNIFRHLQMGKTPLRAAIEGTHDIIIPDLTGTLVTMVSFLPLLGLKGDAGSFVHDIPVVVCAALAMSFLASITITPSLAALLLKPGAGRPREALLLPALDFIKRGYPPLLAWSHRRRWLTLLIVTAAFAGSLALFPYLGMEFFPSAERDQFVIDIEAPMGTAIQETAELARYAEAVLSRKNVVANYVTYIGGGGPRFYYAILGAEHIPSYARIVVNVKRWQDSAPLAAQLRQELPASVPGARIQVRLLEQGPPVGDPIQLHVDGESLSKLKAIGAQIKGLLAQSPGVSDIHDNFGRDSKQVRLQVNQAALRQCGCSTADISSLLATAFSGQFVTNYRAPNREIPVVARLYPQFRGSVADIERLYIQSRTSMQPVSLKSLASPQVEFVTSQIERFNGRRRLIVSATTDGTVLPSEVVARLRPQIDALGLPPGYNLRFKGEAEEAGEAYSGLGAATIIAILLIMLILVAEFKSVRIGLIILLTIPLALIGAILGLYLTGWRFGFIAGLGVTSLAGIVVNHVIVMVDFIMLRLRDGHNMDEAIRLAGEARLRPIMLTSLACIFGLLPLGLSGGSMFAPMCWVVIFGVLTSTLLTLIVVPLVFRSLAGRKAVRLARQAGPERQH